MQSVFTAFLRRDKDNTLQAKKFLGSILHLKGGKAAKNYRRISIDTGYLDEYDAFDSNIEKEGDPGTLAAKRVEGATFGKMVFASTPKLKGFSNIEKRECEAEMHVTPMIPCPECGEFHALTWAERTNRTASSGRTMTRRPCATSARTAARSSTRRNISPSPILRTATTRLKMGPR